MTRFVVRVLARSPLQTAIRILVLAASAALLGAMVLFVGHSLRTMTGSAVRSVPLDWQGPVASATAAERVARDVGRQPGVKAAVPAATAPFAGIRNHTDAGAVQAGSGSILAVPSDYLSHFQTLRMLRGSLREGAVVLDQQLAATLQAQVGVRVAVTVRRGQAPVRLSVSGVAVVTAGDVLFQPLNPLVGPAAAQPPADIAIVPFRTFVAKVAPRLASAPAPTAAAAAVPGVAVGVSWQVQAQVDPAALGGSPRHAYDLANRIRNRAERQLTGRVQFVDNLSDGLSTAAGDALYAEALYIMLAVPGALVGLGLAYLAALGAVERDRRTLRLLRARGASRRRLLGLAALESVAVGLAAGVLGTAGALLATRALVGGSLREWPWALVTCVGVGVAGALAARIATGRGVLADGGRPGKPLWQRLYLDLIALAISGLVYWLTARTGFSAVVNPDSNPTLSLSVYMFLAPALLWIGATLLLVRLRGRLFARLVPSRATSPGGYLLASAGRRTAAINRGLVLVALLLAFAVNLGVFAATYDQQARVDAQLTLGADVVVTGATGVESAVAGVPGVAGTTALDHTYAYVGPDLQDTFGIDAATFTKGSSLRDSYFVGGTAQQMLQRLRARPDGILVSKETVTDYSLNEGDLLRLRTLDHRTGGFHVVPFHVVGVVQEFPSAPRDSFMVANRSYLLQATHDPGPNVVFAKASGNPATVARRVAAATAGQGTLVKNIRDQGVDVVSPITAVDLHGISRIEGAFALLLAAAGLALYVAVAIAERRQEFATMSALGTRANRILSFVWSEVALIVGAA
ncbi:MAG: putative transport system permease protein, partial [Gaiellaceae bacterium]|nr:putative transport system permease protein [Gaiellaceae bacterium]